MSKESPAILLVACDADMRYGSGFRAVDPVVFVKHGRKGYLVVPPLEYGRACKEARRGVGVYTPQMLPIRGTQRKRLSGWVLGALREAGVKRVVVPYAFPHGIARELSRAGIKMALEIGPLFPDRAVKSREELRDIREAQQAAVIAMRTAVAAIGDARIDARGMLIREGEPLTCEALRGIIATTLLARNCFCKETIVAAGEATVDPHDRGHGPLRAGETIILDIFPHHLETGYAGDLTRTVIKGESSPEQRKMYHAVKAAQMAALNAVRPGVQTGTVHQHAVDEFVRRGFTTEMIDGRPAGFIHNTGHGVGLDIHEAPGISPGRTRLRSGHVITIEPGLYYPGIGGVRIEDTIVVTPTGWRYLAPCEKRFEL